MDRRRAADGGKLPHVLANAAALACLLLAPAAGRAQPVPPLHAEEWKLDVVHRTGGRAPLSGFVVEQTPTDLIIKRVFRNVGSPTVVLEDRVPLREVARV